LPKEENEKTPYFGWIYDLYAISNDQLYDAHGKEAVIYLIFMKMAAWYFFAVSVLSCSCLWPIYISGVSADDGGVTSVGQKQGHARMTLENVMGDERA
jgi:hypothetical protein